MHTVAVWTAFVLAYASPLVAGRYYIDPISMQPDNDDGIAEKRVDLIEPTCEELRAMWRYTKRQSRAAENGNGWRPKLYPDLFMLNPWKSFPERPKPSRSYNVAGKARNRAGGSAGGGVKSYGVVANAAAPIYGRMVHKVPTGGKLRNGVMYRPRNHDKLYGTMNSFPPSSRRRLNNFRSSGGGSTQLTQVAQAGSFQRLKELLQAERARELQEQYGSLDAAEKTLLPFANNDDSFNPQQHLKPLPKPVLRNPFQPFQPLFDVGQTMGQARYVPSVPNNALAWTRQQPVSQRPQE